MNRHFSFVLLTSVVFLAANLLCSCGNRQKTENQVPQVRLATAMLSVGEQMNSYPGRTQASETSNASFRVSGTLASVPVKVGDHVRQGQVIARMDSRDYEVQLKAVTAEYESTKAECERIIALYGDNGTSQNNYDKARYGLEQITMKYQHAKDQVADCVLRAPFDGYVQSVFRDSHENVSAGMPVVGLFASKGVEVVINVPAVEYMRADDFNYFLASFDVTPEKAYSLKLLSVGQKANANQLYEVRFLLEDKDDVITPGMTAMVDIFYKQADDESVDIPMTSVFEKDDKSYVFVYDETNGVIRQTEVKMGIIRNNGDVQIVSGITMGQRVVSAGVHHLTDGQQVLPSASMSKTNVGGLL